MKKQKFTVLRSGEIPSNYQKVGGRSSSKLGNNVPKWNFDLQPNLEALLVSRREQRGQPSNYMVYELIHIATQKPYVIFGTTVIDERLQEIPDMSKILIEYKGKPAGKKYKAFDVYLDTEYVFNPKDFPSYNLLDDGPSNTAPSNFERGASTAGPLQNKQVNTTEQQNKPEVQKEYEEPPF